ncbi:MAG: polymerase, sigma-24 subunit, subfamily [Verrucomicrobiales bacterium]|nr:polymerase, sigma-24 subunit, subfamily [Verrucomicrobiales bacterium]
MDDAELLRRYVDGKDESAFAELVNRHVHAVYGCAQRVLRNTHLSEEVSQEAFCLLARKASGLRPGTVLIAWLHRTTWNLAMKILRNESRRRNREQASEICDMNDADQESLWSRVEPFLDSAIESLNETERKTILLRFFERKPTGDIASILGVNESAARMRLSRAVEKLRVTLNRTGVGCSSAILISVLMNKSLQAAPLPAISKVQAAATLACRSSLPLTNVSPLLALMIQAKLKTTLVISFILACAFLGLREIGRGKRKGQVDAVVLAGSPQAAANGGASASSGFARFLPWKAKPTDPIEAAELAALEQLKEILYSTESDVGMPPAGIWEAITASGSKRKDALNLILTALKSENPKAARRAGATLQFFPESAEALRPVIMSVFKNSADNNLIQNVGMSASVLFPGPETIPALVEAFKNNPAAAEGLKLWIESYRWNHKTDDGEIVAKISPLLESEDAKQRFTAASILSRTTGKNDPRLTSALLPGLIENRDDHGSSGMEALEALRLIGAPGRAAADAIREYGRRMPGMSSLVLDALAATAPDLRSEIPELEAKLQAREAAIVLEQRDKPGVTDLVAALRNPEARMSAIKKLNGLDNQAAETLPRLREILKAGDADATPDANNFLFAVATAIRRFDPPAPTFYRPEDFMPAFTDAMRDLKEISGKEASTLREEAEIRMFSPRPFDRNEIIAWSDRLKTADPQIQERFVKTLKRSPGLLQLETQDPNLAQALLP